MIFIEASSAHHYTGFFLVQSDNFRATKLWHFEPDPRSSHKQSVISPPFMRKRASRSMVFLDSGSRMQRLSRPQ
jgi:hypothetical protein